MRSMGGRLSLSRSRSAALAAGQTRDNPIVDALLLANRTADTGKALMAAFSMHV